MRRETTSSSNRSQPHQFLNRKHKKNRACHQLGKQGQLAYELVEQRRLLAQFPTYINGVFTLGDPNAPSPYPLADTFNLSTNPTASKTIYIDLDGHHSFENLWEHDITFPAFDRDGDATTFSDSELIEIQLMFQNMAEDYSPFNVNVTTKDPGVDAIVRTDANDNVYGMRVVHTQATDGFGDGIGGVAWDIGYFGPPNDTPCFAFNKGVNNGALTLSHEVGHTLGLFHDGLSGQSYHPGTGSGPTSWGPIMGAPFGKNLSQWSKGDYTGANNFQDDFSVIASANNGFGYVPDDFGNTIATANDLPVVGNSVSMWGFVGRTTDVDMFKFKSGTGLVTFNIKPFQVNPNLDIIARIYNSAGIPVATSNPVDDVIAPFSVNLTNGTYYLSIDGTGKSGVYSDYGSVGFYTVDGTIPTPLNVIGESSTILGLTSSWKTITLQNSYTNPVIIMGTPSRAGLDPVTVRVRDVKPNSFQVRIDEWEYQDGQHGKEDVAFMVLEEGVYDLPNGTQLQAGRAEINHRFTEIEFDDDVSFGQVPVVLSQVMSTNEQVAVTTRNRFVNNFGFEVKVHEEEAADRIHLKETVGWVAIGPGKGTYNGQDYEAVNLSALVSHLEYPINFLTPFAGKPGFFAQMQSYNGGDPATVRQTSLTPLSASIFIEEERSADAETAHNPEKVGYVAIESGMIVLPPPTIPPLFMTAPDYSNSDNLEHLSAAAAIQRRWGEDSLPLDLHSHDSHSGGLADASLHDDDLSDRLVSFVIGLDRWSNAIADRMAQPSPRLTPDSADTNDEAAVSTTTTLVRHVVADLDATVARPKTIQKSRAGDLNSIDSELPTV